MNDISNKKLANQVELVAEIVHDNWMLWATELLQHEPHLSTERKQRWEKECILPYSELSEQMKNLTDTSVQPVGVINLYRCHQYFNAIWKSSYQM